MANRLQDVRFLSLVEMTGATQSDGSAVYLISTVGIDLKPRPLYEKE